jgi:hypothetical protein
MSRDSQISRPAPCIAACLPTPSLQLARAGGGGAVGRMHMAAGPTPAPQLDPGPRRLGRRLMGRPGQGRARPGPRLPSPRLPRRLLPRLHRHGCRHTRQLPSAMSLPNDVRNPPRSPSPYVMTSDGVCTTTLLFSASAGFEEVAMMMMSWHAVGTQRGVGRVGQGQRLAHTRRPPACARPWDASSSSSMSSSGGAAAAAAGLRWRT